MFKTIRPNPRGSCLKVVGRVLGGLGRVGWVTFQLHLSLSPALFGLILGFMLWLSWININFLTLRLQFFTQIYYKKLMMLAILLSIYLKITMNEQHKGALKYIKIRRINLNN